VEEGDPDVVVYTGNESVAVAFEENGEQDGYYPVYAASAIFSWDSGALRSDLDEEDDDNHELAEYAAYAYSGNMVRVFWLPDRAFPVNAPQRKSIYGEGEPPLGIIVAEFHLSLSPNLGLVTSSRRGVTIEYEVLESATTKDDDSSSSSASSERYVQYAGIAKILRIKVDFSVLVRAHAQKLRDESCLGSTAVHSRRVL